MKNKVDSWNELLDKLKGDIELNISGTAVVDEKPFVIDSMDLSVVRTSPLDSSESATCLRILDLIDRSSDDLSSFLRELCSLGLYPSYLKNAATFNYIFLNKTN